MSEILWRGVEDVWVKRTEDPGVDDVWVWQHSVDSMEEQRILAIGVALAAGRVLLPGSELWIDGDRGARLLLRDLSFDFATGSNLQLLSCDPPHLVQFGLTIRAPGGVGVMLRLQRRACYDKQRW